MVMGDYRFGRIASMLLFIMVCIFNTTVDIRIRYSEVPIIRPPMELVDSGLHSEQASLNRLQ